MLIKESIPLLEELAKIWNKERVEFFKKPKNFKIFWYFHFMQNFVCELAPFHDEWINKLLMTEKSILFEAFRWSLKTELIKIYLVWCICYATEPYIVIQSYDSSWSEDMVRNIVKMLVTKSIINDYWNLFPFFTPKDDFSKKSVTNFDTTNWVKVVSRSLWEKLRGAASFDEDTWSARPTLLILDDIDVIDSVRNIDIIDKNEKKINNETIGAMSKEKARILLLWNTILEDWIVRRFAKTKANNPYWLIINEPIYNPNWWIVWDFFTEKMIDKIIYDEGLEAFNQNYLLKPETLYWLAVFSNKYTDLIQIQEMIREVEEFKLYLEPCDKLVIWIDVAEWWIKGDYMAITWRKTNWKVAFQYKWKVNEFVLTEKLDFIMNYEVKWKKYQWVIFIENNTWLPLINQCLSKKDNWSYRYNWSQFLLKQRKIDSAISNATVDKYWFRMTTQSKNLIIKEYKLWIWNKKIWITEDTVIEIKSYQYDKNNRPNAIYPDHDDLLVSDMIAYNWVLHEDWVVKYKPTKRQIEDMWYLEKIKYLSSKWAFY